MNKAAVWRGTFAAGVAILGIWLAGKADVAADDAWPLLVLVPFLTWWAGGPWSTRKQGPALPKPGWLTAAAAMIFVGVATDLFVLLAAGWSLLAATALDAFFRAGVSRTRLALILVGMFPWMLLDFSSAGWWFRLIGAEVTAGVFQLAGFDVIRQGTDLAIEGMLFAVAPGCSGLRVLQLLLVAGTAVAVRGRLSSAKLAGALLALPVLALVTNTLRIVLITAVALTFGIDTAAGIFHTLSGLLALAGMFVLTQFLVRLAASRSTLSERHEFAH